MKHSLFLQGFAAAILTLCTACATDLGLSDTLDEPQPLVFSATQGGVAVTANRAATDGTWDGTEEVAIQIESEVKKYKVASSGALTPDGSTTPFYRTSKDNIAITAWYPYSDSQPDAPTIASDQRTTASRESSNLMTASATAVYGETTTLQFCHQTARLRLYLTGPESTTPVTGATVTATIGSNTYTAHEDGNGYYSLLVAPKTTVTQDADFLTITASGKTYKATSPATETFAAGTTYNYSFALKCPPYLTFTADAEQGFKMTLASGFVGMFQYSVGSGAWATITSGTTVTFGGGKGTLRLRGVSSSGTSTGESYPVTTKSSTISFTKDNVSVAASGDIRTLVDYKNYDTVETGSAKFCYLFQNCTALTSAPALPAETLATYCYYNMFNGCTGLTTAPELPATTLKDYCYLSMFQGCTGLTTAPELPATTLANRCYSSMFYGCTALTAAPALPAETLATYCYRSMFNGCTALTSAPALPAKTLAEGCYYWMFQKCTGLTKAPALPATTLKDACYRSMFNGCTKLTTPPTLPATELAVDCYREMFQSCGLTTAPALPATKLKDYCYEHMFNGCKALTKAPELPAKTLVSNCYGCMFQSCTNLTEVTIKAESWAERALSSWLNKVKTTNGTIYCKKAFYETNLKSEGTNYIPENWTVKYITD